MYCSPVNNLTAGNNTMTIKSITATIIMLSSVGLFGIAYMAIIFDAAISHDDFAMLTIAGVALLTFCFSLLIMSEKE